MLVAKCPFCTRKQTKKPIKTWKYKKTVVVGLYLCECNKRFRYYKSPKSSWTIPKIGTKSKENKQGEKKGKEKNESYAKSVARRVCKEMYGHSNIKQLTQGEYFQVMFKVNKLLDIAVYSES